MHQSVISAVNNKKRSRWTQNLTWVQYTFLVTVSCFMEQIRGNVQIKTKKQKQKKKKFDTFCNNQYMTIFPMKQD